MVVCQPFGDEAVFWGLARVSRPSVIVSFQIGRTLYCGEFLGQIGISSFGAGSTHSGVGNEVSHRQKLPRMSIDVCLIPRVDFLVLNLEDVDESARSIFESEILESGLDLVLLALQSLFNLGNDRVDIDGGLGVSNLA